ncbi:hypothetical protein [Pectobacterium aroidearum]|uniref:hypothetical protein n=1 Tax=Pectobacterium aroidearum TaxID=1201031 RepID=UPI0015DE2275|nr:hypothetical protein [Pectobacterium aroidearum]MBA0206248.1 hypothetical protein [Pectobacterium aroidearum]
MGHTSNNKSSPQSDFRKSKLEQVHLERIRKRNKKAVIAIKTPLAILIVFASCMVIFQYTYLFEIKLSAVFLFLILPMIVGLTISYFAIPTIVDFLKPLADTIIYIPASILAVCYILNSITDISEALKKEAVHHWYVYVALSVVAGSTIIKCSIAFSESISKYLLLCEKSSSNNLTPRLLLLLKYKIRKFHIKKR